MSREIKFRGTDSNTLLPVYGYYNVLSTHSEINECGSYHKVIDDSVVQFTGLLDVDLVELYEGDTIEFQYETGPVVRGTIQWSTGGYYILKTGNVEDGWCNKVIPTHIGITKIWK
jgi:hypothetical protein